MEEKLDKNGEPMEEKLDKEGKPKRRRWPIVLGVIAVVFLAAGVGFTQWHAQPSFCGAICHTPMDPYVATYNQTPGATGLDRFNQEIANTNGMMAVVHKEVEVDCLGCHSPTIGEQVSEGMKWITGNYSIPLKQYKLNELVVARGLSSGDAFCLNEICHHLADDGSTITSREELITATSHLSRNVHLGQHGTNQCDTCHKSHSASTVLCTQCHLDVVLPEGWLTDAQYQQQVRNRSE